MLIKIDPSLSKPLRVQIIEQIRHMIENNLVESGSHIPSSRKLAELLGVSRVTVYQAYCELQAMGYLQSKPGSYNVVQKRQREAEYNPEPNSILQWDKISNPGLETVYKSFRSSAKYNAADKPGKDSVNFSSLEPDPRLFPIKEFTRSINLTLSYYGSNALNYGAHKGFLPLREYLAKRFRLHGISVSEKEILITNGAQQGIDLILRLLSGTGKTVIIESPTYGILIPLLKLHNVKVESIPMLSDGMDLIALEKILKKKSAAFIYTMPNFHNPTGITTNHQHREKLLQLCLKYKTPLVEDGFEEDLKYYGKVDLPIKSIDENNIVIYVGTFSKALFPGLRIGWITAAGECIERLTCLKRYSDLSSGNLSQAAIYHFCEQGYYDLHLKRLHRVYKKRMEIALKTMDQCLPKEVKWTKPAGGYLIWVEIPLKLDALQFKTYFNSNGVSVSPGYNYFNKPGKSEFFRISISAMDEKEINEGIERLAAVLKKILLLTAQKEKRYENT